MEQRQGTHESLYRDYEDSAFLLKLKDYAYWTIPSAFPRDFTSIGSNEMKRNMPIENDYQSMGAILVNYLAAKLTKILFPITQSFFKINPSDQLNAIAKQVFAAKEDEIRSKLVDLENRACKQLYVNASYAQLIQALRYLIITGNCLIKRLNGKTTIYSLHNYTVRRDNEGTVLDMILREQHTYGSLPVEIQSLVDTTNKQEQDTVTVWTRIKRNVVDLGNGRKHVFFEVSQQVDGKDVGTPSKYPEHLCPFIPVVWNHVNGDSYGRGHVEDHAGDFAKLSDLSRALTIYEIDACKVINLVKPGAVIDIDSMNDAENGEWVQADPQAVAKHEGGDYAKIQQLIADLQIIYGRLSTAFMYAGNTRDAERVTAEEIRQNAQEAEQALGGVYSQLSLGMHLPLSYILTQEVEPMFITGVVANEFQLEVITGLNALGRSSEIQQLFLAIQELAAMVPALKQISQRFDTEQIVDMVLQSHGVNLNDVMLTPEELKQQQEVNAQAMQALDPLKQVQATQQVI